VVAWCATGSRRFPCALSLIRHAWSKACANGRNNRTYLRYGNDSGFGKPGNKRTAQARTGRCLLVQRHADAPCPQATHAVRFVARCHPLMGEKFESLGHPELCWFGTVLVPAFTLCGEVCGE
jgi:hypothetical protein